MDLNNYNKKEKHDMKMKSNNQIPIDSLGGITVVLSFVLSIIIIIISIYVVYGDLEYDLNLDYETHYILQGFSTLYFFFNLMNLGFLYEYLSSNNTKFKVTAGVITLFFTNFILGAIILFWSYDNKVNTKLINKKGTSLKELSLKEKLSELDELFKEKILSKEEYELKRKKIIDNY